MRTRGFGLCRSRFMHHHLRACELFIACGAPGQLRGVRSQSMVVKHSSVQRYFYKDFELLEPREVFELTVMNVHKKW